MASCTKAVSTGWRRSSTRHCRSIFPTKRSARLVRSPTTISVAALGGVNEPVEPIYEFGQDLGEVDKVVVCHPGPETNELVQDDKGQHSYADTTAFDDDPNEIEHNYTTHLGVTTMGGRRSPMRRPFSRSAP